MRIFLQIRNTTPVGCNERVVALGHDVTFTRHTNKTVHLRWDSFYMSPVVFNFTQVSPQDMQPTVDPNWTQILSYPPHLRASV